MTTTPTREAAARSLAEIHFQIETGLTHIFRLSGPDEADGRDAEPIILLEVNEDTIASGILPLHFGPMPARGVPYPSIIVEVTPGEFEQIQKDELTLPSGWKLAEEFSKPQSNAEPV